MEAEGKEGEEGSLSKDVRDLRGYYSLRCEFQDFPNERFGGAFVENHSGKVFVECCLNDSRAIGISQSIQLNKT